MTKLTTSIRFFTFSLLCLITGCSPTKNESSNNAKDDSLYIEFCDFNKNLNKKVRITGLYSGVDEYWGIGSRVKCTNPMSVEFDYTNKDISNQDRKLLRKVHSAYWKYYLEIDAIGTFEMNSTGYGHLNSNKAIFIVDKIIDIELIDKSKPK